MDQTQKARELGALHGFDILGDTVDEGGSYRTPVELESGDAALLYCYETELEARRATRAHDIDFAAQLFVVPELIESGTDWILVEMVEGRNLADEFGDDVALTSLPAGRARAIVAGIGNTLRKLHMLEVDGYGDILSESEGGQRFLTFSGWAAKQLESFTEIVRTRGFDDEVVTSLTASIADLRHELAAHHPRSPAWFSHGRVGLEHVWTDEATGRELVGLTGFHHAATLPREVDIANLLWIAGAGSDDTLVRSFYSAYGAARTMDVQRRERFFRRLAAFLALSGFRGPTRFTDDELVGLTSR